MDPKSNRLQKYWETLWYMTICTLSNTTLYVRNPQSSNSCRLEVAINKNLGFQFVCRHRVGNQQPNAFYLNIFVCAFPV